jgi:hypothetical protein
VREQKLREGFLSASDSRSGLHRYRQWESVRDVLDLYERAIDTRLALAYNGREHARLAHA